MEDNKEMMTVENEEMDTAYDETEEVQSGNGGATLLIGALLGAGAYALGRKVVGWWKNRKAKEPTVEKTDPEVIDITPDSDEEETEE